LNLLDNHVCCLFSLIVRCIFHTNLYKAAGSLRDWLVRIPRLRLDLNPLLRIQSR